MICILFLDFVRFAITNERSVKRLTCGQRAGQCGWLEGIEKAALFLRLSLLCMLIRHEKAVVRERASKRSNLKKSFVAMATSTVLTIPLREQSFFKTLFKTKEFENAGF